MRKKIFAFALAATMVASLMAGCKKDSGTSSDVTKEPATTAPQQEEPTKEAVQLEDLPEAFTHITFDGEDEGYKAIVQVEDKGENSGATFGLAENPDATFLYANGPVDKALYLDGSFGIDLGLKPTNTDTYSVSFWVNADRLATFGPTLQFGQNIGMADGNNVCWINVTQSEWGADSAKIFPIVWSRNEKYNFVSDSGETTNCWPWMYAFDNEIHGKREWVMVTIVATGEEQTSSTGVKTCGAKYYINGSLVYDSQENYTNGTYFEYTWDATLAPGIMQAEGEKFESYFGINYWDTVFKGYVDDLYVFDSALTDGQVAKLFSLGNKDVESTVEGVEPATDAPATDVTITGTAVGATDCSAGFWSQFSQTWAVASGESVSKNFINWHGAEASNWNNFFVVLQNVADVHSTDDDAAYKEYAVVRSDNYGWNADGNTADKNDDGTAKLPWTLESDWDWGTFSSDLQGAKVTVTVTNNGTSADVVCDVTTASGATHFQKYLNIPVDGDLFFCLGVDGACLDLLD